MRLNPISGSEMGIYAKKGIWTANLYITGENKRWVLTCKTTCCSKHSCCSPLRILKRCVVRAISECKSVIQAVFNPLTSHRFSLDEVNTRFCGHLNIISVNLYHIILFLPTRQCSCMTVS